MAAVAGAVAQQPPKKGDRGHGAVTTEEASGQRVGASQLAERSGRKSILRPTASQGRTEP